MIHFARMIANHVGVESLSMGTFLAANLNTGLCGGDDYFCRVEGGEGGRRANEGRRVGKKLG